MHTREFIQVKSHTSVHSVRRVLSQNLNLMHTREFTQVKSPTHVFIVRSAFPKCLI
uniref:Uncharacterized protein n=2 Tax=Anguilla anguilla TaxID=7936 RepID=A0A0E9X1B0_ANGAN